MTGKHLVIFLVLVIAAVIYWSSLTFQETFNNATFRLEKLLNERRALGISIFVGLAGLSAMLSPFSSLPLVPAAVVIWTPGVTFVFLLLGWVLGGGLSYLIGRFAFLPIFKNIIPFAKIEAYRSKIPENSKFLLVFLFRLAMPAEIPGYLLGIIGYHFPKYILATMLAELPFALIAVYASESFVSRKPLLFTGLIFLQVLILALAFFWFSKKLKS